MTRKAKHKAELSADSNSSFIIPYDVIVVVGACRIGIACHDRHQSACHGFCMVPLAPGPGVKGDGCPSMAMSAVPASCCRPSSLCLINTWTHSTFSLHRKHTKLQSVSVITVFSFPGHSTTHFVSVF